MALTSVIVPTHNRRERLLAAVDSVRRQHGTGPLEIVVVADRCGDGTVEAVAEMAGRDARIKLLDVEANGERSRTLYVIKSRGMSHSNQVREFVMSAKGVGLVDAYIGPAGVLTGTAAAPSSNRDRQPATRQSPTTRAFVSSCQDLGPRDALA